MALSQAELQIVLKAVDDASQVLQKVGKETGALGGRAKDSEGAFGGLNDVIGKAAFVAGGVGAAYLGVTQVLGPMVGKASDVAESMAKTEVVFGDAAGAVKAFADGSAENLGLARSEALSAAGTFGNLFTSMGLSQGAAADMSTDIVRLAADLGSFNNVETPEVLEKIRAGLVGETEPLRSLGVNLNAAAVESKALELGLLDANGEVNAAGKAQATYALILEQTKNAQGDFARTSDGVANSQRILAAKFEDLQVTLGEALLPVVEALLPVAIEFADILATTLPAAISVAKPMLELMLIPIQAVSGGLGMLRDLFGTADPAEGVKATAKNVTEGYKPITVAATEMAQVLPAKVQEAMTKGNAKILELQRDLGDKLKTLDADAAEKRVAIANDVTARIEELEEAAAGKLRDIATEASARVVELETTAAEKRKEVVATSAETIADAHRQAQKTIDDAIAGLAEDRKERTIRQAFEEAQEQSRIVRGRALEDAEVVRKVNADLQKAKTADDRAEIQARFKEAQADLVRRRAAEDADRAFSKQQAQAKQAFDDKLRDEDLKKTIAKTKEAAAAKVAETQAETVKRQQAIDAGLAKEVASTKAAVAAKSAEINTGLAKEVNEAHVAADKKVAELNKGLQKEIADSKTATAKKVDDIQKDLAEKMPKIKAPSPDLTTPIVKAAESARTDKALYQKTMDVGKNVAAGVGQGAADAQPSLIKAIANAVQGAIDAAKAILGISSPSKVAGDELGRPLGQGIAAGIAREVPAVRAALAAATALPPVDVALRAAASVGGRAQGAGALSATVPMSTAGGGAAPVVVNVISRVYLDSRQLRNVTVQNDQINDERARV